MCVCVCVFLCAAYTLYNVHVCVFNVYIFSCMRAHPDQVTPQWSVHFSCRLFLQLRNIVSYTNIHTVKQNDSKGVTIKHSLTILHEVTELLVADPPIGGLVIVHDPLYLIPAQLEGTTATHSQTTHKLREKAVWSMLHDCTCIS